jgi:hypothetical protein
MNGALSNDRRTSGALAVLLVLLLVAAGGGFAGAAILQTKWLELETLQSQLDVLKRHKPAPVSRTADVAITVKPFLAEQSFALAANALQKRVVGLIEETEGKLITVGVDPQVVGDEELARRVSIQVTAELTNEALQKVLYELESAVPFAFVDSFAVSRKESREPAAKNEAQTEPRLSVSMSVTGYRRKGSS